ncbi:nuclear transport factor 2 family protein [Fibrella aquatilis]|uniref:Nuclear transport factor 2 family protein n=1 Tax=Fibrella aquatilis TaxID=2817059 RepID=A0A939K2U6_9BACT|nr:nuclear transport factor 2 family protein [Fibrella aquatilis]MBO0934451.1 nuclear transport factor 2 family protein [Fibrella aquatilis]
MTGIEEANVQTVVAYVEAYNRKDIDGMMACLAEDVNFEHLVDGHVTMKLTGKPAFRQQAEAAAQLFSYREQVLNDRTVADDVVSVKIDYRATLAVDMPDGPQAGETLSLTGHSVFVMKDRLIARLTDIS